MGTLLKIGLGTPPKTRIIEEDERACTLAMDFSFTDLIGKIIEIYQGNLMVVSKESSAYVSHLRRIFERYRKYDISLNPKKSIFGINKAKLLGHAVSEEGI